MSRILVTGADGQLGNEIRILSNNFSEHEIIYSDVADLDLTQKDQVYGRIKIEKPDILVNCAAYTAVDKAESEPELAYSVNAKALEILGEITSDQKIFMVHISTDFVFDGTKSTPYTEVDTTNPLGVYGKTKLDGEIFLQKNNPEACIFRTSWLYSSFGKNFVKTMIQLGKTKPELGVIFDQIGTPTYARDLAGVLFQSFSKRPRGLYHYSQEGVASWYDFATQIMGLKGLSVKVKPIETHEYPTPAKRPHYSVLNKKKIKADLGISIAHWKESLENCLRLL